MKIIFLGGPGTGKSTVGKKLATDLNWQWVSTGEILRQSTEPWVQERLKTAELFDDEMMAEIVFPRLMESENVILDGYPRTERQVDLMVERGVKVDLAVEMSVPKEEAIVRVLARGREQDTREIVEIRWEEYVAREAQVVARLVGSGVDLVRIDGMGTPEEVYKRTVNEILGKIKEKQQI